MSDLVKSLRSNKKWNRSLFSRIIKINLGSKFKIWPVKVIECTLIKWPTWGAFKYANFETSQLGDLILTWKERKNSKRDWTKFLRLLKTILELNQTFLKNFPIITPTHLYKTEKLIKKRARKIRIPHLRTAYKVVDFIFKTFKNFCSLKFNHYGSLEEVHSHLIAQQAPV